MKKHSKSSDSKISQKSNAKPNFVIQPKLKVSQPSDIYEQEADRVADQIMRMSESRDSVVSRKCSSCEMQEEEELKISRKSDNSNGLQVSDHMAQQVDIIEGGGHPLDDSTRSFMESRFGFDFSRVRIHTDEKSTRSAEVVNAQAYAVGNDVIFSEGSYRPSTSEGKRLLAHELAHVIQQSKNNHLDKKIWLQRDLGAMEEAKEMSEEQKVDKTDSFQLPSTSKVMTFWFNAFIPNSIPGTFRAKSGEFSGRPVFPGPYLQYLNPYHWNSCFETDDRGFDPKPDAPSSRMSGFITIDPSIPHVYSFAKANDTFEIDCTSGKKKCKEKPTPHVTASLVKLSPYEIGIEFEGTGSDPCVLGAPNIAIRGGVIINFKSRKARFAGNTTYFPAFEMYANFDSSIKEIFHRPPKWGTTMALFIPALDPFYKTINF